METKEKKKLIICTALITFCVYTVVLVGLVFANNHWPTKNSNKEMTKYLEYQRAVHFAELQMSSEHFDTEEERNNRKEELIKSYYDTMDYLEEWQKSHPSGE